ncbi:MAG: PTS sugar transporter subunit IIA [Cyclonatronaceae bacterium]
MNISELLEKGSILLDIEATEKEALIRQLINELRKTQGPELAARALSGVLERERVMSTAVGKGIAIPHTKLKGMNGHYAIFARLREPIDFGAVDGKPVRLVFLLVGAHKNAGVHIKILSKISRLLNHDNFRIQLLKAPDAETLIRLFKEEEEPMG